MAISERHVVLILLRVRGSSNMTVCGRDVMKYVRNCENWFPRRTLSGQSVEVYSVNVVCASYNVYSWKK